MADLAVGVGTGLSLGALTEFETWFDIVPEQTRRPFPVTRVQHIDQSVKFIGSELIELYIGGVDQTALNTYVTAIFGNYDTYSVDVTIYARDMDGTMTLFDAKAILPSVNNDLVFIWHDQAQDLRLQFYVI